MHPREPDGAGPSPACAPAPARHRPVAPGAARLLCLNRLGGFPWPGRLEGLLRRLGPAGERPPGGTRLRADALGDMVAAPTIVARALHRDDRLPAGINGGRPAETHLARRTGRLGASTLPNFWASLG
jgi:hypothetical protein